MTDSAAVVRKVRSLSEGNFTDGRIEELAAEGLTVARRGLEDGTENEVYTADMLAHYVLAQLSLENGDIAMYNNYISMYNTALLEYRRAASQALKSSDSELIFKNVFC